MPDATPASVATGSPAPPSPPPAPGAAGSSPAASALTSLAAATASAPGSSPAAPGAPAPDAAATKGGDAPKAAEAKAAPSTPPAPAAETALEVKFPDGVQVDAAYLESFKGIAKELGLDSAKAQKLADLAVTQQAAAAKALDASIAQTNTEWATQVKAQKDYPAQQAAVARAMQRFATPEVAALLNGNGDVGGLHLGSNPVLFGFLARIGAALSEDSIGGTTAAPTPASDANAFHRALYKNTPELFPKE